MSETEKPFTVNDRRHFTADGEVREDPPEAPEPTVAEGPAEASGPPPAAENESTDSDAAPPPSDGPRAEEAGPADFSQFLLSLGAQAGMLLSGQGLPEGADPKDALPGARSIISILEMLSDKTAGRRTAQEDEVIEGLLYELRMAYVERSRAGGS